MTMTPPVRIIQVGAGGMGRAWLRTLAASTDVELVGLVDLDLATAQTAATTEGFPEVATGTSLSTMITEVGVDAVLNVTVPEAHHPVNVEALFAGLPVLCEKPVAPTVAQALSLAAAAEASGQLLMISQSRRYYNHLSELKRLCGLLGRIGAVDCEFAKAPHFGGFRDEMPQPLLVDMAIHQFDLARYLLEADPVSVYCESFNPSWSWYAGDASAVAVFGLADGTRFSFHGSWCAPGLETSWNGRWRVGGEHGTALWNGDDAPEVEAPGASDVSVRPSPEDPEEIAGSLAEFVQALRSGATPQGEVHSNVISLAMVEAAVQSAATGRRVAIDEVLNSAYAQALKVEQDDRVRKVLKAWPTVTQALRAAA